MKTVPWLPMKTAPTDGTSVLLRIEGGEHSLSDDNPSVSIGSYGAASGAPWHKDWTFAGWCWHQDEYCQGSGTPTGWLPLPGADGWRPTQ